VGGGGEAEDGEDDSSGDISGSSSRTAEQVHAENTGLLVDFYQEHDPEKVGTANAILGAWKTKKLPNALTKKYGQAPPFVGCSVSMGYITYVQAAERAVNPKNTVPAGPGSGGGGEAADGVDVFVGGRAAEIEVDAMVRQRLGGTSHIRRTEDRSSTSSSGSNSDDA
jgi:hypothetical protein